MIYILNKVNDDKGLSFKILNRGKLNVEVYDQIYRECDFATPFHSLNWLDSIDESRPEFKLYFIVASYKNNNIAYMPIFISKYFPLSFVSSPYDCYGGFICHRNNIELIKSCSKKIISLFWKVNLYGDNFFPFLTDGKSVKYKTWILNCNNSYEQLFKGFSHGLRYDIRKSRNSGIDFKKVNNEIELEQCLKTYQLLVQKHNITKPYSEKLFRSLYQYSLVNNDIIFFCAKMSNEVIAFSVFLLSSSHCFYWISAANNQYAPLNATKGIVDHIIQYCCSNNIAIFNMGAVPDDNTGLLQFKESWGAIETQYIGYGSKLYNKLRGGTAS